MTKLKNFVLKVWFMLLIVFLILIGCSLGYQCGLVLTCIFGLQTIDFLLWGCSNTVFKF